MDLYVRARALIEKDNINFAQLERLFTDALRQHRMSYEKLAKIKGLSANDFDQIVARNKDDINEFESVMAKYRKVFDALDPKVRLKVGEIAHPLQLADLNEFGKIMEDVFPRLN